MQDMIEEWKAIPGFEGFYEVSNKHRVRSLGRLTDHGRHGIRHPWLHKRVIQPKILKTSINNGYIVAYLCNEGRGRKAKMFYVEKAVLQLFPETIEKFESLPGEEWANVVRYEGLYCVSSFGRILSLDRVINDGQGKNRYIRSRVRVAGVESNGYPKIELAKDGGTRTMLVHRLVAEAFIPNPLGLKVVHHKDEDKRNCRSDNLEWTTNTANVTDWFDRRRVVVSADTIETIGAALAAGKSPAEILAALPKRRRKSKAEDSGGH